MLFTFITHPDARQREGENDPCFRGLTDKGVKQAISAAQRIRELFNEEKVESVDTLLSSPTPRCLEALAIVGKAMYDMVKTDTTVVHENLQAGNLTKDSFDQVLKEVNDADATLVFGHADVGGLFKDDIQEGALNGIWLKGRPVIALAKYERSALKLLCCEKLEGSAWVSIMRETRSH